MGEDLTIRDVDDRRDIQEGDENPARRLPDRPELALAASSEQGSRKQRIPCCDGIRGECSL